MHPKTLTRRLRTEGTTFRRLLDEVRLELAERYLRQPGLSVEEVAYLLGYSERQRVPSRIPPLDRARAAERPICRNEPRQPIAR